MKIGVEMGMNRSTDRVEKLDRESNVRSWGGTVQKKEMGLGK
jgi:hypothetical protein